MLTKLLCFLFKYKVKEEYAEQIKKDLISETKQVAKDIRHMNRMIIKIQTYYIGKGMGIIK